MPTAVTVADLVTACRDPGVNPADAILLIEPGDHPIVVTEADPTVSIGRTGLPVFGLLLDAPCDAV